MAETATVKRTATPAAWQGQVTIEAVGPRNCNPSFNPIKYQLRGRFRKSELLSGELATEGVHALPDVIPGQHLSLDGRTKSGRIHDPLADGTALWKHLVKGYRTCLMHQQGRSINAPEIEPMKDSVYERLDSTGIKTWLYWMRRLVDADCAVVIFGTLPTLDEIARLPGKTAISFFNTNTRGKRSYREDLDMESDFDIQA